MKLGELLSHEDPIIVNLMKSLTIEASMKVQIWQFTKILMAAYNIENESEF